MKDETTTPAAMLKAGQVPRMVRWYAPKLLFQIGVRSIISSVFGQYADHRMLQVATDQVPVDTLVKRYDYSDPAHPDPDRRVATDEKGGVWIDYVADVGDGFLPSYAVAHLLAKPALDIPKVGQLPGGSILLMGGDQAYPEATRKNYQARLQQPFDWAYDTDKAERKLFVIPGNHDWYDGLSAFDNLFCGLRDPLTKEGSTKIGGWATRQHRSYWAIRLPHDWWIWGCDIQFSSYLDDGQIGYFDTVADQMCPGHKVILCLAEPSWLLQQKEYDEHENLNAITMLARKRGAKVLAVIAGDSHHYARYTSEDIGTNFITAGGGGAFLHATHDLRAEVAISWPMPVGTEEAGQSPSVEAVQRRAPDVKQRQLSPRQITLNLKPQPKTQKKPADEPGDIISGAAEHVIADIDAAISEFTTKPRCYPDRWQSAKLSLRNLWFPLYNLPFAAGIGLIYWILTWSFLTVAERSPRLQTKTGGLKFEDLTNMPGWQGLKQQIFEVPGHLIEAMFDSIGLALGLLGLLAALIAYADVDKTRGPKSRMFLKIVIGFLHWIAHVTAMMVLMVVLIRWHVAAAPIVSSALEQFGNFLATSAPVFKDTLSDGPFAAIIRGRGWVPHVLGVAYPFEMMVLGGFAGGQILGIYWVIASVISGMHCADSFAALRITRYRNFLRMRFDRDRVTIYPIGLDRVPRKDAWRDREPVDIIKGERSLILPKSPLKPRLIERPIVIRDRDVKA